MSDTTTTRSSESDSTFTSAGGDSSGGSEHPKRTVYKELLDLYILAPLRTMWSDWRTRTGIAIIVFYLLLGTVGVQLIHSPSDTGPRLIGMFKNMKYPLGTNNLGEGILANIAYATPPMLKMITAGAVFSTVIATVIGTVAGYKGGYTDRVLSTISDIAMTIPGLPLIMIVAVLFTPESPYFVGVVLAINAWAGLARMIRSQVLELRDQSYVEASRIMDVPLHRIILDDILPNIMPYVLISFVNTARAVIFGSVALYYLGVLPSDLRNWGLMLNRAYSTGGALYSWRTAYWIILPMGAIVLLSFGLVLFSQGTERLFNPRIRARHAETVEETAPTQEV